MTFCKHIVIFNIIGYNYPGNHQFRANGTYCDRECGLEGLKENCPIKTFAPVNRLYCNSGYARDYNCVCVPLNDCPRFVDSIRRTSNFLFVLTLY